MMLTDQFLTAFHEFVERGVFPRPNRGEHLECTGMFARSGRAQDEMPPSIRIVRPSLERTKLCDVTRATTVDDRSPPHRSSGDEEKKT